MQWPHDVLMMPINFTNSGHVAILDICSVDYRWIINGISKSEASNLLEKADLNEKKKLTLKIIISLYYV